MEIGGLGVDEDKRGQGIGRQLIAEERIQLRDSKWIGLEVTESNPQQNAVRALYKSLGYRDAGR